MHKSYHRSEPQVLGSGLGEIKKVHLIAYGTPLRRKERGEGVVNSLNKPVWESCKLSADGAGPSHQGRRQ